MNNTTLYLFCGLPGTGKSTLASKLAMHLKAVYLRIDTIEQGLRDLCGTDVRYEGYQLAHQIAAENLQMGNNVVCDSCNPLDLTRRDWEAVAIAIGVPYTNIEVTCSDQTVHRRRVETRKSPVTNLKLPTWQEVENREYHPWSQSRVVVDTANRSVCECFAELVETLGINNSLPSGGCGSECSLYRNIDFHTNMQRGKPTGGVEHSLT